MTAFSACCTVTLTITADNAAYVYHNGGVVLSSIASTRADDVSLENACVLAVKAVDSGDYVGILASTSTGVVSDASWKCSSVHKPGWHMASFDDSAWSRADVIGQHGDAPWYIISGIDAQAKWIWVAGVRINSIVYCRKTLC